MILLAIKHKKKIKPMFNKPLANNYIYADNSATTKVREEVSAVILKTLSENFGNPSSIHRLGKKAKQELNEAKSKIGKVLNANSENVIFTSGGTEANNLVIFGLSQNVDNISGKKKHIITSKIEHSSVKEPLEYLEQKGWGITWLDVDKEGFVDLNQLKSSISKETLLVSIIHGNNEIGTIQNLKEITNICKKNSVCFHSDCIQTFCKIPIDLKNLDIDFITISGHKIYGPKGVGALYVKNFEHLSPILIGGGQENKIRPGTESLPNIVGFGYAAELLNSEMEVNIKKLRSMQINLMEKLLSVKNLVLTGPNAERRIPGHVSFCVKGIQGESLVLQFDLKNIAVSSASACSSNKVNDDEIKPSHVVQAIGMSEDYVKGSLRVSLGRENTESEVDYIVDSVKEIVGKLTVLPKMKSY
jgi:cysteine desulfurase